MQEYAHEYAVNRLYSPSDIGNAGGLRLIRSGTNLAKPNYQVGPKRMDYYSVHFVVDGSVRFAFDGETALLAKGDLFCMFPGDTVYEYRLLPAERTLRMYWLAFDGVQAPLLLEQLGLTAAEPCRFGLVDSQLERLLKHLVDEAGTGTAAELALLGQTYSLFAELYSAHREEPPAESGWLDDCIRYMELHYTEAINVNQIAQDFGLNRSYVTTAITKRIGQSPGQYIQSLRLQKGARLLRETDLSVTEIALTVGYPDLYSFSRSFANVHGLSPSKYRSL